MALISLSWSFHPHPEAQKPHFSSAQGSQSLVEVYWSAALPPVHVYIHAFVSPWALLIQTLNCRLTLWLDLSPVLLSWTFLAIARPYLNPDLQTEFLAWPQTCLIATVLPCGLDSRLVLAIIFRVVLLASFRYCG